MGRACDIHWRGEKCIQYFGWNTIKGRDHSEDIGVDGRIMLEWILDR